MLVIVSLFLDTHGLGQTKRQWPLPLQHNANCLNFMKLVFSLTNMLIGYFSHGIVVHVALINILYYIKIHVQGQKTLVSHPSCGLSVYIRNIYYIHICTVKYKYARTHTHTLNCYLRFAGIIIISSSFPFFLLF